MCEEESGKGKVEASWEGSSALKGAKMNYFKVEADVEGGLLEEVLISGLAMVEHGAKWNRQGFGGTVAAGARLVVHPFQGESK